MFYIGAQRIGKGEAVCLKEWKESKARSAVYLGFCRATQEKLIIISSFRNHGRSDVENVGKKWFWCFWGVNWVRFSRFYQKKSKKNFQKKSYLNLQILIFRNFSEFARNSTALKNFKYFFWCTNKRRFYWCYIWKEFGAETCSFAAKSDEGRVTGSKSGTKNWKSLVYLWNVLKPTLQTKSSL